MVRTLVLAIGLSVSVSSAQGAFTGIEFVQGDSAAASAAIGANAITVQLFAVFDGPGGNPLGSGSNFDNTVLLAGFADINTTGPALFFQEGIPFGSDFAPKSSLFGFSSTLQYDTYGTIGVSDGDDPRAGWIAQDPDGVMTTTHIGGGWFSTNPPLNIGSAVANANLSTGFGTLLFQMTVLTNGGGAPSLITGSFTIFTQDTTGTISQSVAFSFVPAPSAVGFFGVAGFAALRRRR